MSCRAPKQSSSRSSPTLRSPLSTLSKLSTKDSRRAGTKAWRSRPLSSAFAPGQKTKRRERKRFCKSARHTSSASDVRKSEQVQEALWQLTALTPRGFPASRGLAAQTDCESLVRRGIADINRDKVRANLLAWIQDIYSA